MSLMSAIKEKQLNARKSGATVEARLLTTLLGEASAVGKNDGNRESTDAEVVAVVKKFIKNIKETIAAQAAAGMPADAYLAEELSILEEFLPKQLSELELSAISDNFKTMPEFMKFLKDNHAGCYDGKMASMIAKQVYH